MAAKFVIERGSSGKYRFNLKAGNGEKILTSESYREQGGRSGRHRVGEAQRSRRCSRRAQDGLERRALFRPQGYQWRDHRTQRNILFKAGDGEWDRVGEEERAGCCGRGCHRLLKPCEVLKRRQRACENSLRSSHLTHRTLSRPKSSRHRARSVSHFL